MRRVVPLLLRVLFEWPDQYTNKYILIISLPDISSGAWGLRTCVHRIRSYSHGHVSGGNLVLQLTGLTALALGLMRRARGLMALNLRLESNFNLSSIANRNFNQFRVCHLHANYENKNYEKVVRSNSINDIINLRVESHDLFQFRNHGDTQRPEYERWTTGV